MLKLFQVRYALKLIRVFGYLEATQFALKWMIGTQLISGKPICSNRSVFVRRTDSDIHVLWQIFGERECDIDVSSVKTIVDLGAYVGYSTIYFSSKYPDAKIYAVEPERDNFRLLESNTNGLGNLVTINRAIWNEDDVSLRLRKRKDASWLTHVEPVRKDDLFSNGSPVKSMTLRALIENNSLREIDILKIDIEGAEEMLLLQADDWIEFVRNLVIEAHSDRARSLINHVANKFGFTVNRNGEKFLLKRS